MDNEAGLSHSLIKMLLDRETYYKSINFVKLPVLADEIKTIITDLDYYFLDCEETDKINIDDFGVWFSTIRHSNYSSDALGYYLEIFNKVKRAKTEQVEKLLECFNLAALKFDIENALAKDNSVQTVIDICQQYLKQSVFSSRYEQFFHDMDDDESDINYTEKQLPWRLACLNKSIGRIGPGDFGIIFGGTNAGKTSFLCSEVSNMMNYTDKPILWLYNEGYFVKLKYRFWSSCLKLTNTQILQNIAETKEKYREYCKGNINKVRFCDATKMSIYDVENLVREIQPGLVIIDQLDNLSGFDKSQRDDIRALKLFQRCRAIAINNSCPILVSDQAVGTEGNKKDSSERWYKRYLGKEQLQGSRQAKQSTAEFMIGIGYDAATPDARYITTPKVKSLEGENNNESQTEAWFLRQYARFKDS